MIIFSIENKPQEYAKCFAVMKCVNEGTEFRFEEPVEMLVSSPEDFEQSSRAWAESVYDYCHDPKREKTKVADAEELDAMLAGYRGQKVFCLCVKNIEEADCLYFHYFELIRKYAPASMLFVEPLDDRDYFRISYFFRAESMLDGKAHSQRFCKARFKDGSNKIVRLSQINTKEISEKENDKGKDIFFGSRTILPLLRIDNMSHSLLSTKVFEIFDGSELFDVVQKSEGKEILNDMPVESDPREKKIYTEVVKNFCEKLMGEVNVYIESNWNVNVGDMWRSYYDQLSQLSVLGLCYLASYLHMITVEEGETQYSPYDITSLIFQAEDFSAGTLQLIENSLLHSEGGYFSYRIHNAEKKERYLRENYNFIVKGDLKASYLEILISDYNSQYDIPAKFRDNCKKYDSNIAIPDSFCLQDFFKPSKESKEFWGEYYSNAKNVALHYGLNIFEQVVVSAGGCFVLRSSQNTELAKYQIYESACKGGEVWEAREWHIPGSQYKIILPIHKTAIRQNSTGLNMQLDGSQISKNWGQHTIYFVDKQSTAVKKEGIDYISLGEFKRDDPKYKEASVERLTKILLDYLSEDAKNQVIVFDVKEFQTPLQGEVFVKALICTLDRLNARKIAVIHASGIFMRIFIRTFGLLYYKKVTRNFMNQYEIFLSGESEKSDTIHVEIIFKGKSIAESFYVSKAMADHKGEYTTELTILENVANKCEEKNIKRKEVKVFPFDLLIQTDGKTLFQEKTIDDLSQDLQQYRFGCRLSEVHMRVGSKIHISDFFYEATLLFGIESYVSRFAFLLAKRLGDKIKGRKDCKNIVLIGYETYSEMLMIGIKKVLKEIHKIDVDYFIYEDYADYNKFRGTKKLYDYNSTDTSYVIIVPIGSTLTTHDKVVADLKREVPTVKSKNIVAHLCVVLIRDSQNEGPSEIEKMYWESVDDSQIVLRKEYDIGDENIIGYIVSVHAKWQEPDKCELCFPLDLYREKPILKVSKASVVPMIMVGIHSENNIYRTMGTSKKMSREDLSVLKGNLRYGHFVRDDNHFEYYFQTEKLCTDIINNPRQLKKFDDWMGEIKQKLSDDLESDRLKFDFIVAPQHATNAEFVMQVSKKVFHNPAGIVLLDVKKEYRDNIKTKFSYITQLYFNLKEYGRKSVINFHYVDDTITSGKTFGRTKTLLQSLFPKENDQDEETSVQVNVFSSIILLLGRCSADSERSYVKEGRFWSYINLNISALRNYKDACVLCKRHDEYLEMRKLAATNDMALKFDEKINDYRVEEYNKADEKKSDYGYERMVITHELNARLGELAGKKNENSIVEKVFKEYMKKIRQEKMDAGWLCTFIYVISNPFLVFRKSVMEAAFELLLHLSDYLLYRGKNGDDAFWDDELKIFLNDLIHNDDLYKVIKAVLEGLSYIGANYLIRIKTINAFLKFIEKEEQDKRDEWIRYYCVVIKQTIMFNRQDSRVLRLENILRMNHEEQQDDGIEIISVDEANELRNIMIMENNLILSDTLKEAVNTIQEVLIKDKENLYYKIEEECGKLKFKSKKEDFTGISKNTSTDLVCKLLFDKQNDLRKNEEFLEALKNTVSAYFCEAYRKFSGIENSIDENDKKVKIEKLMEMSVLFLLLMPDNALEGSQEEHIDFYRILIRQMGIVLETEKIQLFMSRGKTLEFIFSSDGNNVECDERYMDFLKGLNHNENVTVVGDTYIYSGSDCLDSIKIVNNSLEGNLISDEQQNIRNTAWYLVFARQADLDITDCLRKARNLLVMRENLLMRLKKDYDNNLYEEFADLRKKVKKLTDDRAGGHTPFAELSEEVDYFFDLAKKAKNHTFVANSMKLIADSLISKLYVCHINEHSYPRQIAVRKNELHTGTLGNYKKIMLCASELVLRYNNSVTVIPDISFDEVDWHKKISLMNKTDFIWIAIFYAMVMNALRHGKSVCTDERKRIHTVKIDVSTKSEFLVITNDYVQGQQAGKKEGITLETTAAFFQFFQYDFEQKSQDDKFIVKIPLKRRQDIGQEESFAD